MTPRRLFVAGSTGAVGRTLVRLARERGVEVVPHARPLARDAPLPEGTTVFALGDAPALDTALAGCTTIVQLVGTTRRRFARGDTYETSDVETTRLLVDAATRARGIDHVVLLSAVGAGRPVGAYLRAKATAERLVRAADVPWTIVRPSAFEGEGHRAPPGLGVVTAALGLHALRPIAVATLAGALLRVAAERAPLDAVLEGRSLWALAPRG